MEKYIYINYAYEDQQLVMPVIDALRSRGIAVKYGNGSEDKLKESSFVLHLCTPASHTSHTYRKMMNYTLKHEKDMTLLRIGDAGFESDIDDLHDLMLQLLKYHYSAGAMLPEAAAQPEEAPAAEAEEAAVETAEVQASPENADAEPAAESADAEPAADAQQPAETTDAEVAAEPAETKAAQDHEMVIEEITLQTEDKDALYSRGMTLLQDESNEKNAEKAFNCFWQAANRGQIEAQYQLSVCYAQGIGVRRSISEAARYCEMAAYGGHAKAQAELGYCYETGYGVVRNMPEAIRWYRIASDQGSTDAKNNLAYCYQKGRGVSKDIRQAIHYYEEAAAGGHASAQFNLGFIYWYGEGVLTDRAKAIELFEAAAAGGNARATEMMKVIRQLGYVKN